MDHKILSLTFPDASSDGIFQFQQGIVLSCLFLNLVNDYSWFFLYDSVY